jgi:hypothetical protein
MVKYVVFSFGDWRVCMLGVYYGKVFPELHTPKLGQVLFCEPIKQL